MKAFTALVLLGFAAVALAQPRFPGFGGRGPGGRLGRDSSEENSACSAKRDCMKEELLDAFFPGATEDDMYQMKRDLMGCARSCFREAMSSGNLPPFGGRSGGGGSGRGGFPGGRPSWQQMRRMRESLQCADEQLNGGLRERVLECMDGEGQGDAAREFLEKLGLGEDGGRRGRFGGSRGRGGGRGRGGRGGRDKRAAGGSKHLFMISYMDELLSQMCPDAMSETQTCVEELLFDAQIDLNELTPENVHATVCAVRDSCDPEGACAQEKEEKRAEKREKMQAKRDAMEAACRCHDVIAAELGDACGEIESMPFCADDFEFPELPEREEPRGDFCDGDPPTLDEVMEMLSKKKGRGRGHHHRG